MLKIYYILTEFDPEQINR